MKFWSFKDIFTKELQVKLFMWDFSNFNVSLYK